ncbi:Cullin repeat-like-containing domain protein [Lipomyces japonicus]|uniref:Cullin repeat-like-containing domain protein n=1 Tax=Lipomyces japonicus TaxID=56871 RepID=UPI0034CEA79A
MASLLESSKDVKESKSRRKRRVTAGSFSPGTKSSSSTNARARESIIPSMSHNYRATDSENAHEHEKVGKLLSRYSNRYRFGSIKHKSKKDKSKAGLLSSETIPDISLSNYPSLPESKRTINPVILEEDEQEHDDNTINVQHNEDRNVNNLPGNSELRTLSSLPMTKTLSAGRLSVAVSPRSAIQNVQGGIDEKDYPITIRPFQENVFDADKFIQQHLSDAADYQVRDYLEKLNTAKIQVSKDMQRNLFNNYTQFVLISSEISTLEQEIRSTRNMVNELCNVVGEMKILDADVNGGNKKEDDVPDLPILRRQATRRNNSFNGQSTKKQSSDQQQQQAQQAQQAPKGNLLRTLSSASNVSVNGGNKNNDNLSDLAAKLLNLDVMIAHRRVDEAIKLIQELKVDQDEDGIDPAIHDRALQVFDILLPDFTSEFTPRKKIVRTIMSLLELGFEDSARDQFLNSRTEIIDYRVRQIQLDPEDIPFYISQVSTIVFTLLRTAIGIYVDCFTSNQMTSKMVDWTRLHVEKFSEVFTQATHSIPPNSQPYLRTVAATKLNAEQLKEIGMNMDFLLKDVLDRTPPALPERRQRDVPTVNT